MRSGKWAAELTLPKKRTRNKQKRGGRNPLGSARELGCVSPVEIKEPEFNFFIFLFQKLVLTNLVEFKFYLYTNLN